MSKSKKSCYAQTGLIDYKFFCFEGKSVFCQVISSRSTDERVDFFDMNWNRQNFTGLMLPLKPHSDTLISRPVNFCKMAQLAETLAKDIHFLRVDFYEVNGKAYFGECTFYPSSGLGHLEPSYWENEFGDLINVD